MWSLSLLVAQVLIVVQALRSKDIDQLINGGTGSHYGGYPSYQETMAILNAITTRNPLIVKPFVAGISVECRPIYVFMLSGLGFRKSAQEYNEQLIAMQQNLALSMLEEESVLFEACKNSSTSTGEDVAKFWSHVDARWSTYTKEISDTVVDVGGVMFTALHHAREPTSLTVPLNTFHFLTEQVGNWVRSVVQNETTTAIPRIAQVATALVAEGDIYFVPFVNPDGYAAIDRGGDTWIRKNRRRTCTAKPYKAPLTMQESIRERLHPVTNPKKKPLASEGVDLNRNYDNNFKSAHDGCDVEEYEGPFAFSEPETRAVRRIASILRPKVALNFHAYGDLWTHPFNCCPGKKFKDGDEQIFAEIKESLNITLFGSAPDLEVLGYTTSGEADDYLYEEFGIISMSPEVGPEHGGFYPDKKLLRSINTENLEIVLKVIAKTGPQLQGQIDCLTEGAAIAEEHQVTLRLMNTGLKSFPAGRIFLRPVEEVSSPPSESPGDHLRLSLDREWTEAYTPTPPKANGNLGQEAWMWKVLPSGIESRQNVSVALHGSGFRRGAMYEVCFRPDPDSAQQTSKMLSNLKREILTLSPICHCAWLSSSLDCDVTHHVPFVIAPTVPIDHPCANWSVGADE